MSNSIASIKFKIVNLFLRQSIFNDDIIKVIPLNVFNISFHFYQLNHNST